MKLSKKDRQRLIYLLGMMGAANENERGVAALHIERFRQEHQFTWDELLNDQRVVDTDDTDDPEPSVSEWLQRPGIVVITVLDAVVMLALGSYFLGIRIPGISAPSLIFVASLAVLIVTIGWPFLALMRTLTRKGLLAGLLAFIIGGLAAVFTLIDLMTSPD